MSSAFADLKLSPAVVGVLSAMRIVSPTGVQSGVIPHALAGRDVLGRAPTGSGKTLAFGLPLLHRVETGTRSRPRGLVLAPTRELAEQIRRDLEPLAAVLDRTLVAVYGGVALGPQAGAIEAGADIVIATPGRLLDLVDRDVVDLGAVDRVVIDEADRLADMGFLPDVCSILDLTSAARQTLLFSATLDGAVSVLTGRYQTDPVWCTVGNEDPDMTAVNHRFILVRGPDKVAVAADVVDSHGSTLVFCRTRHGVDRVCRQLRRLGIKTGWIHGGRSQNQRDAALAAFVDGRVQALVATDVAARGIHVDDVSCVLHFDPPADAKDYVHRSGRTARAGAGGDVITFVTNDQRRRIIRLQQEVGVGEGFETARGTERSDGRTTGGGGRSTANGDRPRRSSSRTDEGSDVDRWESSTAGRRRPKRPSRSTQPGRKRRTTKRSGRPRPKNKRSKRR